MDQKHLQATGNNAYDISTSYKHDTNNLPFFTRGLYVGGTGDVKIKTVNGDTVTFVALAAGVIHPIAAKQVFSTGTTATDIVGVY